MGSEFDRHRHAASGNNTDNRSSFHVVAFIQRVEPWDAGDGNSEW